MSGSTLFRPSSVAAAPTGVFFFFFFFTVPLKAVPLLLFLLGVLFAVVVVAAAGRGGVEKKVHILSLGVPYRCAMTCTLVFSPPLNKMYEITSRIIPVCMCMFFFFRGQF